MIAANRDGLGVRTRNGAESKVTRETSSVFPELPARHAEKACFLFKSLARDFQRPSLAPLVESASKDLAAVPCDATLSGSRRLSRKAQLSLRSTVDPMNRRCHTNRLHHTRWYMSADLSPPSILGSNVIRISLLFAVTRLPLPNDSLITFTLVLAGVRLNRVDIGVLLTQVSYP